jgi:hypothetical protein
MRQNALAKARSEALNLRLNLFQRRASEAIRHVTISPSGMPAGGRASAVEQARLRQKNKGTI